MSAMRAGFKSLFKASIFIRGFAAKDQQLRAARAASKDLTQQLIDQGADDGAEIEQYNVSTADGGIWNL